MLTRIVGVFAFLFFVLSLVGILLDSRTPEGHRPALRNEYRLLFPMPVLALEFAGEGRRLGDVITNADNVDARKKLLDGLDADSLFIPMYLLLYVGMALVLAHRGRAWAAAAALAAICAVLAAAYDGRENLAMARLVERHAVTSTQGAPASSSSQSNGLDAPDVKTPGVLKWALIFVAVALLSLTFWGRDSKLSWAVFVLCALAALLGFAGLLVLRADAFELRLLELAFVMSALIVPLVGYLFTFRPGLFGAAGPR
jgi:hypothetical protein